MKASLIEAYGGPEEIKFKDVEIPKMKENEVLIKVAGTSFNPADAAIRSGAFKSMIDVKFPYILGLDVAGVIESVGASVEDFKTGDRVFGCLDFSTNGASAEYVSCDASLVTLSPKTISLVEAASLPGAAYTAWQALFDHGNLQPGNRILITAAAGGVGTIAVQLAKWKGAYVIGTASERSHQLLNDLDIDEIIDYNSEVPLENLIQPVDVIFNLSPMDSTYVNEMLKLLKPNGILISASKPADASVAEKLGVRAMRMAMSRDSQQLSKIAALVDEQKLHPVITNRYPLSDLSHAHREAGKTNGKTVIIVDGNL